MVVEIQWPELADTLALAADEAHVFAVSLEHMPAVDDELLATLSAEDRQRAERFQLEKPQQQFVVGRAALRRLLGRHLDRAPADVEIRRDSDGKPRIAGADTATALSFNLAHSGELVLLAITTGCEIGVDVERVREVGHLEQIARRYFHATEVEAILSAPIAERDAAFLRCWTAKEAVVKALGGGLHESLSTFRVPTTDHDGSWVDVPSTVARNATRCWLQRVRLDSIYVAAVACVGEQRRMSCFTLRM